MDRRFILGIALLALMLGAGAIGLWDNGGSAPADPPVPVGPQAEKQTSASASASASAPPLSTTSAAPALYILAIEWFPSFCAIQPDLRECDAPPRRLALHGLWPDGEYCGIPASLEDTDRSGRWGRLPVVELSTQTWSGLRRAMPGVESYLERHEWVTHGSCSGVSQEVYFARAVTLFNAVADSAVGDLFKNASGRRLTRTEIASTFDTAFGDGTGQKFRLSCEDTSRGTLLEEMTIALYGDPFGDSFAKMIRAARQRGGGCQGGIVEN